MKTHFRRLARKRRHARVRKRIHGTAERPRLAVYRSLKHIYAQVIDDEAGHTLVAASSLDPALREHLQGLNKTQVAAEVGKLVAKRSLDAGIETIVFDRGGFPYHGRVRALAEGAREAGLKF
ncbi:MAG: 50S ribosomal protein L18 [Chloroflexi bacterium]|nr:50S ribosomal protein L18 [Chloroflexota bacterium]